MSSTETPTNPFANFKPDTAQKILDLVQELCIDTTDASAHLAGVLVGLTPKVKHAVMLVEFADYIAREFEKHHAKCNKETDDGTHRN